MKIKRFYSSQKGQGLTEYAVVLSLVAVASIAAMAFFGGAIEGKMAALSAAVSGQTKSKVDSYDKMSKNAAEKAAKKAKTVGGTTSVDSIFDKEEL